jgi:hypothetical protein
MNDRVNAFGSFLGRSVLMATCSLLLAQLSASASLLTAGVDLGASGSTEDWAIFTLGIGPFDDNGSELKGSASIMGNVAVADFAAMRLNGHAIIQGNVSLHRFNALDLAGHATISGGTYFGAATMATLQQGVTDAKTASAAAFSLSRSAGYPREVRTNESLTLSGSGAVVLKLRDFRLSGNAVLTLQGDNATTFVINVKDEFSLSGKARV